MEDELSTEQKLRLMKAAPHLAQSLMDLVDALDATNWSSWQATDKFWPALHKARELLLQTTGEQP